MFGKLGECLVRRPLVWVGCWVAIAAALLLTNPSLTQMARERPVAILPSRAPSLVATQQMTDAFHEPGAQTTLLAVLTDDKGLGPADEVVYRTLVDALRRDNQSVVALQDFLSAPPLRQTLTSKDQRAWYLPIGLPGELGSAELHDAYGRVADIVKRSVAESALTASLAGPPATEADLTDLGARELPLIEAATALTLLVIVLIVYRNPVTGLLPLLTTGIALLVAQSTVAAFSQAGLAISNPAIVLMTGVTCGAGVSYAIFLISRYQDYVRLAVDSDLAVKKALVSVGNSIAVSAATVAVACLGMTFTRLGVFRTVGPVLAIAICVTLLAEVTLLPAMLVLAGRRGWITPRRDHCTGFWRRSETRIARRPTVYLVASVTVLIMLAGGARLIRDNYDDRKTLPDWASSSVGYATLARHFSVNSAIPQYLVVHTPEVLTGPDAVAALRKAARRVQEMPDIAMPRETSQLSVGEFDNVSEVFANADGLLESLAGSTDPPGGDTTVADATTTVTTMRALGFAIAVDVANIADELPDAPRAVPGVVNTGSASSKQAEMAIHGVLVERDEQVNAVTHIGDFFGTGPNGEKSVAAADNGLICVVGVEMEAAAT
jgi:putative drug exporter of the RND superfamily